MSCEIPDPIGHRMGSQATKLFKDERYIVPSTSKGHGVWGDSLYLGCRVKGCGDAWLTSRSVTRDSRVSQSRGYSNVNDDMLPRSIEIA